MALLIDLTVREFLERLSASNPTPGGGSASALAGALGASLLLMVASMPKAKSDAEDDRAALVAAASRLKALRDTLAALIDRDTEAYNAVMAAYRLPKANDEEKAARRVAIQQALVDATATPIDIMRACAEALTEGHTVARLGNPSAASDVDVGLGLLEAASKGALKNVDINLESLSDRQLAEQLRAQANALRPSI